MKGTEELEKTANAYVQEENDQKFNKKYPGVLDSFELFGKNQNEFNKNVIGYLSDLVTELSGRCNRLEESLAAEVTARKKDAAAAAAMKRELDAVRLRSTLNTNHIEKVDSAMVKYGERTDDYMLYIAPGVRLKDCPKGCRQADVDKSVGLSDRLEAIRKSSGEERGKKLHDLEMVCMKAVSRSFSYFNAYEEVGIDFYGTDKYAEAIFQNLCKNSIYKIEYGHNSGDSGRYFVYCGENMAIPESAILKSGTILISGQDPLSGLSEEFISDLRFLNDCGIHSYITFNSTAYTALVNAGFRNVSMASDTALSGGFIAEIETGIENAVPNGAMKYSVLVKSGIKLLRSPGEIMGHIMKLKNAPEEYRRSCIKSLEKTVLTAIIKNYFGTTDASSSDLSQTVDEKLDFVTGFDYLSHFDYTSRKALYKKAESMLKPDGLLIFSGKNPVTGIKIRAVEGWEKYPLYEAMWTSGQLAAELEENGFRLKYLVPTGTGLYNILPEKYSNIPSMYIVGATPLR